MAVNVRPAKRGDAGRIAEFAVALFELHAKWDAKRFTQIATVEGAARYYSERAEADGAAVFVAELDERVVGFAYMEYEPVLYAELATKAAWLHDIFVEPNARGSGVGKALLAAVSGRAKEFGAAKVLLSVALRNEGGQRLFERNGFRTTMLEMMLEVEN